MIHFLFRLGSKTIECINGLGAYITFFFDVMCRIGTIWKRLPLIMDQIFFVGVLSFVIIVVSGAFIGMVVALQGEHTLAQFGATGQLSQLIALSVFRELGPVVTALLYVGRSGSSTTAEIGLMKITEQLSSMEVMAVSTYSYVALPRIIAGVISVPLLTIIFSAASIFAGFVVSVHWLGVDPGTFLSNMQSNVSFEKDVMQGIMKSVVFGFVVTLIAIYNGFNCKNSSSGLAIASTKTVVYGALAILALDFVLTASILGG